MINSVFASQISLHDPIPWDQPSEVPLQSASSASSHDSASNSPAVSDHNSQSTSHKGDGRGDDGMASSDSEAPKTDEHQDSDDLTVMVPNSDNAESRKTGSDIDGPASPGSHNSSDSEEEEVVTVQKTA